MCATEQRLGGKRMNKKFVTAPIVVLLCVAMFVCLAPLTTAQTTDSAQPTVTRNPAYIDGITGYHNVSNPFNVRGTEDGTWAAFIGTSTDHAWLIGYMNVGVYSGSVIAVRVLGGSGTLAVYVGDSSNPSGTWYVAPKYGSSGTTYAVTGPGWYYFTAPRNFGYISITVIGELAIDCVQSM